MSIKPRCARVGKIGSGPGHAKLGKPLGVRSEAHGSRQLVKRESLEIDYEFSGVSGWYSLSSGRASYSAFVSFGSN